MPSTTQDVPHCSQCGGAELRSTPPTKSGCYRICSACAHMWHEPTRADAKRAQKAAGKRRAPPAAE